VPTDFRRIIDKLLVHDVDFIVVGALSSVLQGAPISFFDIDIVHARDRRLLSEGRIRNTNHRFKGRLL